MRAVLKYPGSKWNIAGQLAELIPPHHSYLEPYFGSGALLFNKAPSDIETVNDLGSDVTTLFRCIQKDPERLARLVMTTPFSREEYDKQFIDTGQAISEFEKAAGFLIRMWMAHGSRNDKYKAGWKYDAAGREKMYSLWNWYRLPEWIIEIAERLRQVQIENRPALEVIRRFNNPAVFMYLAPPYLLNTRAKKQYIHEMEDSDHENLLQTITQSQAKIMISGYDSDMYNEHLAGWKKEYFQSFAEGRKPRMEIIWMNYEQPWQQQSMFSFYDRDTVGI